MLKKLIMVSPRIGQINNNCASNFDDDELNPHLRLTMKKSPSIMLLWSSDMDESDKFEEFRRRDFSLTKFALFQLVLTLYLAVISIGMMINYYFKYTSFTILCVSWYIVSVVIGWILVYILFTAKPRADCQAMEQIWILMVTLSANLYNWFIAFHEFHHDNVYSSHGSIPPGYIFPKGMIMLSMLLPTVVLLVLEGSHYHQLCICWTFTMFSNAVAIGVFQLIDLITIFLFTIPVTLFTLVDIHRKDVSRFILTEKVHRYIYENQRMTEEMQNTELRHMIGNVAHDLKTVSLPIAAETVFNNLLKLYISLLY